MPNLYQLSTEYLALADRLANTADEDGVVDESLLPAVSEARDLVESKATSVVCVIKELAAYKAQIDAERDRLKAMSDTLAKRIEYLTENTSDVLQKCGIVRIEGVHATISFRKSESVEVCNQDQLPEEYLVKKVTVSPDKAKIRAALKSGAEVPGAYLESHNNIQIK